MDSYPYQGTFWKTLSFSKGFDVSTATFKQAFYYKSSGMIDATYTDSSVKNMRLRYVGSRDIEGTLGDNWHKENERSLEYVCQEKSAASCKFKVKL